jgi:hypothetical protein
MHACMAIGRSSGMHGPWAMATRRRLSTRTWQWRMCCVVAMRLCEAHACMHGRAHSFQEDKLMQHATIFVPGKKKPAARGRSMEPAGSETGHEWPPRRPAAMHRGAGRDAIEGPAKHKNRTQTLRLQWCAWNSATAIILRQRLSIRDR